MSATPLSQPTIVNCKWLSFYLCMHTPPLIDFLVSSVMLAECCWAVPKLVGRTGALHSDWSILAPWRNYKKQLRDLYKVYWSSKQTAEFRASQWVVAASQPCGLTVLSLCQLSQCTSSMSWGLPIMKEKMWEIWSYSRQCTVCYVCCEDQCELNASKTEKTERKINREWFCKVLCFHCFQM